MSGRWSPDEDQVLLRLRRQGLTWPGVATAIPGRSADACASRWAYVSKHPDVLRHDGRHTRRQRIMDVARAAFEDGCDASEVVRRCARVGHTSVRAMREELPGILRGLVAARKEDVG